MRKDEHQYQWAELQTADGRRVASRQVPGMPLVAGKTSADLFDLVRWEDGRVALFSMASQGYLSARPEWLGAWAGEIGETEIFTMIDAGDGQVAFQLSGGKHYLSAPAGDEAVLTAEAISVGSSERFVVQPFDLAKLPQGYGCCCSAWTRPADDEPGILWNDETHQKILHWAIIGLHRPAIQNDDTRRLIHFWSRAEFQQQAYLGLDDADYKFPWRGSTVLEDRQNPRQSIYTWHDHFYNPATQKNYMQYDTSALTQGRRNFNLSVYHAMRILKLGGALAAPPALVEKAGHYLGLSLHFLTDLTQPMHAANFANVFGEDGGYPARIFLWDRRHSGFEIRAEEMVKSGYLENYDTRFPLGPEHVSTTDVVDATWFLHHTAVNQSRVFQDHVLNEARSMSGSDWSDKQAKPALDASLLLAPKAVARYLTYWARCANQTWDHIDPRYYYRIQEPTKNEFLHLHWKHVKRGTSDGGTDRWFLLFNPDGSWSIGNKNYKQNLWLAYDGLGGRWIGEHIDTGNGTPPPSARFHFVRNFPPGVPDDSTWIYESGRDEPVIVNEEGFDSQRGYLIVWPNYLRNRKELFRLEKMEPIDGTELSQIKSIWPHFLEVPWFGKF